MSYPINYANRIIVIVHFGKRKLIYKSAIDNTYKKIIPHTLIPFICQKFI